MTNAVQCLVADIAARLHRIEGTLQDANQTYVGDGEGDGAAGEVRLRLSHRVNNLQDRLEHTRTSFAVEDTTRKLDILAATLHPLLPSYISHDSSIEPVEEVDDAVAEQHFAVLLRELQTLGGRSSGLEELQQMKSNMQILTSSTMAANSGTNAAISDILSYELQPKASAVPADDKDALAKMGSQEQYDLSVDNARRSQDLLNRIAAMKARYTRLADYTNKQLCFWDMAIDDRARQAKAATTADVVPTPQGITTSH